ncbi:MAG TPA: hypothetical protein VHX38_12590 [Pseudonocardiaceae bacterium]|jgi:hypothetical protein|nr:hypothetical protein [Pseudonocardiaceae bacterium]
MRRPADWLTLLVLLVDAVILAVLEMFFLPLRFDGTLLPDLGGWPFPVTVLVAAVTMPWLVARAGDASTRLLVVGAPLWVWLATIGVVGLAGTENLVLLEDWRGLLLLAAGTLPSAVALGNALGRRTAARRGNLPGQRAGAAGGGQ